MRRNGLKPRLKAGEACFGSWLTLGHPTVAEVMALAGFDWLAIDMEHGIVGIETVQAMVQAINTTDVTPLIRVPWNDPVIIKQVLETGSLGLVIPQVSSRREAEAAVRATRFPPHGIRGIGCQRGAGFGTHFDEYLRGANDEMLLVIQIESVPALEHLEEILSVDGVDVALIGANDLSASMGLLGQPTHPSVLKAIDRVLNAAHKLKIAAGLIAADADEAGRRFAEGFQFVGVGHDVGLLSSVCREMCRKVTRPSLAPPRPA